MKRVVNVLLPAVFVLLCVVSCKKKVSNYLPAEADSLAYVIGLNVGHNLMQMDSTLNVEALCAGIRDVYGNREVMTMADARDYYLRQMNYAAYERFRQYEEQFLADLVKNNRSYARTRSGVAYRVDNAGNQQKLASSQRDTLKLSYRLTRSDGSYVKGSAEAADTVRLALSELVPGMQELLRMVGVGGHAAAWIPSDQAYGVGGNEELGVDPNTTLFYEVDVIEVESFNRHIY
ncbi:MAG: FKBP-type peptidyl-prolyl cis-trans isomerase [Alistipes sp.]|nr:FKBP-type peptidyl-prolyl cis-trans isomerase [Alistipes sp.]